MLNRYSLRRSIPALLGLFAIIFALLLLLIQLPISQKNALDSWRSYTDHMLIQLQSSLNDHLHMSRTEEMFTELAELGSLPNVRWAAVVDSQLNTIAATRLGLEASIHEQLAEQPLSDLISQYKPSWRLVGEQSYLAIYPLNRTQFTHQDVSAALLVELDFAGLIRQTTYNAWLYLGQALILLFVLGFILNNLYFHLVVKRIAHIGRITQRYAANEGTFRVRTNLSGNDEISALGADINSMLMQLENNHKSLEESEHMLRSLINAAPIGLLLLDEQHTIIEANPAAQSLFNMPQADLCRTPPEQLFSSTEQWLELIQGRSTTTVLTTTQNTQSLTLEASTSLFDKDEQRFQLILLNDISERKLAEQRLHYLANYDILTGLANRNNILAHLESVINEEAPLSVLLIDLDHFQYLNDSLGHNIGDQLLKTVANRLQTHLSANAILARSGGDEFMVAVQHLSSEDAELLTQSLLSTFSEPFKVLQYELYITASIGIAHSTEPNSNSMQLLRHVDLALHQAKKIGRNCYVTFNNSLATDTELRQQLTEELRHAMSRDEFELFYQPQVDGSSTPISMESLLRWRSSTRGLVGPDQFIPILEETGMILDVSRWVFRTACRQATLWNNQGTPLRIAVNLSPLDFLQADLAGSLIKIMHEERTPAHLIELEVTENSLLDSGSQVQHTLKQLKAAGLVLFLDDFGTGYSSLTYIKRFEFDGVKIDREFVMGLPDCKQSIALVQGILTIATTLNLEVIAEGVETTAQADFLRQCGCQRLQGYYFSKPKAPAEHFSADNTLIRYT